MFRNFLLRVKSHHWTSAPTIVSCSAVAVMTASSWSTLGDGAMAACASGKDSKLCNTSSIYALRAVVTVLLVCDCVFLPLSELRASNVAVTAPRL